MDNLKLYGFICCGVTTLILLAIFIPMSFYVVDFRRFGFLVNAHSQWINMKDKYYPGRHFVLPGRYIVPFSTSNYTIMLCDNCTTYANGLPSASEYGYYYSRSILAKSFEGINLNIDFFMEYSYSSNIKLEQLVYLWYRKPDLNINELISEYMRFYINQFCQRFQISKFYENRGMLSDQIKEFITRKMKKLFDIDVTNAGSLSFSLPDDIEAAYEDTKIEEQKFIREVNKINEYIEQLEGDVSVAEIEAQRRRSAANIEYDILFADADVEEKLIREKVKSDAYIMEQSKTKMLTSVEQTGTINGTASTTVTQQDNLLAYFYAMNYIKNGGYKHLFAQ